MSTTGTYGKQRRETLIAAGNCGYCGKSREAKTPGGATGTRCATCAANHRAGNVQRRQERAKQGACRECGAPVPGSDGKSVAWCAACLALRATRDKARYTKRVKARRCVRCRKQMPWYTKEPGSTATKCAACAKQVVLQWRERVRQKRLANWDGESPLPADFPRTIRIKPKPLGRVRSVGFGINKDTLNAINELKRRYRETNPDSSFRCTTSELLRNAIATVLKQDGPLCVERERICMRGWSFTMVVSLAMYQQITLVANARFGGSRAWTIRVALRQAVNPPFICKSGGLRVPGGRPRDPWED